MATTTVRVDENIRKKLKELSKKEGVSIQIIISNALEFYQRKLFLDDLNKAYAKSSKKHLDDEWENTINDGLDDESWNEHGELLN